jgi:glycosyltransferase involved in cell wall biosynthesis
MESLINYTFIIPHHNIPHLLQRCLSSIPKRNDVQIIVIDDNSNPLYVDFKIFQDLRNGGVEVYFVQENKGAGYARNIGIKHAKGKWLLFADADDFYNTNFIEILDNYVQMDFDILFFSVNSVDSNTLLPARRVPDIDKYYNIYRKEDLKTADYVKYQIRAPWNKMFLNSFIKQYDIVFDEIIKGNDITFSFCACYLCRSFMVDISKLYCVTYRSDSMTFCKPSMASFHCDIANQLGINAFFKYIKRKNWRQSIFINKYLFAFYKYGVAFFIKLIILSFFERGNIFSKKYHIINEIEKRKSN